MVFRLVETRRLEDGQVQMIGSPGGGREGPTGPRRKIGFPRSDTEEVINIISEFIGVRLLGWCHSTISCMGVLI